MITNTVTVTVNIDFVAILIEMKNRLTGLVRIVDNPAEGDTVCSGRSNRVQAGLRATEFNVQLAKAKKSSIHEALL
jgi:hypothetical protein